MPDDAWDLRRARELRLLHGMIRMFCRDRHGQSETLCIDCRALAAYAEQRLRRCPFGAAKPVCRACAIHCYAPNQRAAIRAVMRHAGPRLLLRRPWAVLRHLLHSLR